MKVYKFYDEGWWDQPGCSCCNDTYYECYYSDDTDCNLGFVHSLEEVYVQAIITSMCGMSVVTDELRDELYQMELDELKSMSKDLNISVKIV